jgi:hypothetical protein
LGCGFCQFEAASADHAADIENWLVETLFNQFQTGMQAPAYAVRPGRSICRLGRIQIAMVVPGIGTQVLSGDVEGSIRSQTVAEHRFDLTGKVGTCSAMHDVVRDVAADIRKQQWNAVNDGIFEAAVRIRAVQDPLNNRIALARSDLCEL